MNVKGESVDNKNHTIFCQPCCGGGSIAYMIFSLYQRVCQTHTWAVFRLFSADFYVIHVRCVVMCYSILFPLCMCVCDLLCNIVAWNWNDTAMWFIWENVGRFAVEESLRLSIRYKLIINCSKPTIPSFSFHVTHIKLRIPLRPLLFPYRSSSLPPYIAILPFS